MIGTLAITFAESIYEVCYSEEIENATADGDGGYDVQRRLKRLMVGH